MAHTSKRDRKLLKKGYAIRRKIRAHPKFKNWDNVKVKVASHRLRLTLIGRNAYGDPWQKKVEIGLRGDINLDTFVGGFQPQKKKKSFD